MKRLAILCTALLLGTLLLSLLPTHGEEVIYDSVIRLHVLANSDSEADQADKLAVRDAILPLAAEQLKGCTSREEAAERLQAITPTLTSAAEETLRARGAKNTAVAVTLSAEQYPTRGYDGFCFPAGEYLSFRVMLGDAAGQNWWCVLFPSLCLSVARGGDAEQMEEAFVAVGLTPEQYRVITESDTSPTYRARFKLLEILAGLKEKARRK